MNVEEIIDHLHLEPLPGEGGYFRRIYTHSHRLTTDSLPPEFTASRDLASAIYYLITNNMYSALHRLDATETFHFHFGDAVEMLQLHADGSGETIRIGNDLAKGESPFAEVPSRTWQGTRLIPNGKHGYALLSIVVTPGFDWDDFELADRHTLVTQYPEWQNEITSLTR
ncbi:cupin domain-containing protein [Rubellicoccus peritrichatus]|uniref:Cupin domain-containing protein n=1 Tax=Rubellicoccus peritrichatus TaxID=3080537 RepID=A0AAQ3QWY7_9BACT|nr:cupin domain-containing protein [Puniceicoccus sp. CR14]WOO42422.1 cupin domain-containing protein [Puniceicoccus sp. CR14]